MRRHSKEAADNLMRKWSFSEAAEAYDAMIIEAEEAGAASSVQARALLLHNRALALLRSGRLAAAPILAQNGRDVFSGRPRLPPRALGT